MAFEDGARADGEAGGGDIAAYIGFGADAHGASAVDGGFDLAADDQAAAVDAVGHDGALFFDGDDADGFDDAAGLVGFDEYVLEAQGFIAEFTGEGLCFGADLLRFIAMQADDRQLIVGRGCSVG